MQHLSKKVEKRMVRKRKGETALIFPERNTVGALKEENYDGMHEYPIG